MPKFLLNCVRNGRWVRVWRDGRGRNSEIVVQIWNRAEPVGEPDGDWAMPGVLGVSAAVAQAELQTPAAKPEIPDA